MRVVLLVLVSVLMMSCGTNEKTGHLPITKLELEVLRWEKNVGDFSERLSELVGYQIVDARDAKAICRALSCERMREETDGGKVTPSFRAFASLFGAVYSDEAYDVLITDGLPQLRGIVGRALENEELEDQAGEVLSILSTIATYRQERDVALIVKAVRKPYYPENAAWSLVFAAFDSDHPGWKELCDSLRDPLPEGGILLDYLDLANTLALDGVLENHPFGSKDGVEYLGRWISSLDEEDTTPAYMATIALAFVDDPRRDSWLRTASKHHDGHTRMEAAWAMARIGEPLGKELLIKWSKDVKYSYITSIYLKELGLESDIPEEAKDPDFAAMAEMCAWLAHPMEFGRPPDEIAQFDKRELYWPPAGKKLPVWLFRYKYEESSEGENEPEEGVGMVGSMTFAVYSQPTKDMSPEDIYGLHCNLEMQETEAKEEPDTDGVAEGRKLLAKYNEGFE